MLNLRIEDRNPHLKDELHEIMVENKDIFQAVLNGEDELSLIHISILPNVTALPLGEYISY